MLSLTRDCMAQHAWGAQAAQILSGRLWRSTQCFPLSLGRFRKPGEQLPMRAARSTLRLCTKLQFLMLQVFLRVRAKG